jgi:hypothetical protein
MSFLMTSGTISIRWLPGRQRNHSGVISEIWQGAGRAHRSGTRKGRIEITLVLHRHSAVKSLARMRKMTENFEATDNFEGKSRRVLDLDE